MSAGDLSAVVTPSGLIASEWTYSPSAADGDGAAASKPINKALLCKTAIVCAETQPQSCCIRE